MSGEQEQVGALGPLVGYHLRRAFGAFAADFAAAMEGTGMRQVLVGILAVVSSNPGINQGAVGRLLGIKRANMVPLIAGLTAQNYLEKSPVDGRSFALSLTPRGEEARARVDGIMDAHEAGFARLLADVDQQQLRAALSLIASGRD